MGNPSTLNLIKAYYQAFNERQWETFFGLLSDSVAHDLNQGPRQVGVPAFREFISEMNRCYSEKVVNLVVLTNETGDRAAAEFVIEGTYLQSQEGLPPARNQTYRLPVGAFFEIQNGKVQRITNYYNLPDWIHQVQK